MKKILITGGTVFVSRYAAQYFVDKGYEVYVVNRNSRPQVPGVKLIEADLLRGMARTSKEESNDN